MDHSDIASPDESTAQVVQQPRPKRRWLRFSLSGFLLAVAAFSVYVGYIANRAENQRRAVEQLQAWGVQIRFDYQKDPIRNFAPENKPPDHWLRSLAGDHTSTKWFP